MGEVLGDSWEAAGPVVTNHALKRCRKRLGVPKKAVEKMVGEAWERGLCHKDFSGSFRRYLDGVFLRERCGNQMRVHNGHLFLFSGNTLVTVWGLPPRYRKQAAAA